MLIKSVKLNNIRSYLNQEIRFPEGSVLLSGDIGSGKSTILLAVEFALFGIKRGELSGEALLRRGKQRGSVELRFFIGNKSVVIKRSLKKTKDGVKQDTGYIIIDGRKKEGTPTELKVMILDILGYPAALLTKSKDLIFRYTVYTPQERMKSILTDNKEMRLDTLRRVFDIDKYKRIRENSLMYIKELKDRKRDFENKIADLEEKKKQMQEKEQEIKETDLKIEQLLPDISEIRKEKEKRKDQLKEIEEKISRLNELKKQMEVNTASLKEKSQQELKNKEMISALEAEIADEEKKIAMIKIDKIEGNELELEQEVNKKLDQINNLRVNYSMLREKSDNIKKKIDELNQEINKKTKDIEEFNVKEFRLKNLLLKIKDKKEVEDKINRIEGLVKGLELAIREKEINKEDAQLLVKKIIDIDKCPLCMQEITKEHKNQIHKVQNNIIEKNSVSIEKLEEQKEEKEFMLKQLKNKIKDIIEKEKDVAEIKTEIKNMNLIKAALIEKQKQAASLMNEKYSVEEKLGKTDIKGMQEEVDKKVILLKKIRKNNSALKEKENILNIIKEKNSYKQKLIQEQEKLKKEIALINAQKTATNKGISEYKGIEEEHIKIRKEMDDILEKEKILEMQKIGLEKEKEGVAKIVALLEKEIKVKEQIKKEMVDLGKILNWLENYFMNLTGVIEKHVMARLYSEFNELFQQWFNILIEDEAVSIRLDDEFSPVVEQDGYEAGIENLSGGEKTAVALAYRLSLNKVINDLIPNIKTKNIIMLDEPTDGFSTEQLDRVRDVLDQLNTKQTIIVSHESKIESFVDNIIKVAKSEHTSVVFR